MESLPLSYGSVEPRESYKSPSWTTFDPSTSPPSVNRSRNRAINKPFLNDDGKVSSKFLLPSLRDDCPSHSVEFNMTLDTRFHVPFSIKPRLGEESELKPNSNYYSDFSTSLVERDLKPENAHKSMVIRFSNSANAA